MTSFVQRLKQFAVSVYSWKLNLIIERMYVMSLNLEELSAGIDKLTAEVSSFRDAAVTAKADRDAAVQALADMEAKAASDKASDQAAIDSLTAKLNAAA